MLSKAITVFAASCRGDPKNCVYDKRIDIRTEVDAVRAFSRDTTFAEYKGNRRSNRNFLWSNALAMDVDNDHSDDPADWTRESDIAVRFPGVPHIIHRSRHHLKQKGDRTPRPRFHVIFLIDRVESADACAALKARLQALFPLFDPNALDGARFFFGTEEPDVTLVDGTIPLDEFLDAAESEAAFAALDDVIPEGSRNSTLFRVGCQIARRCDTDAKGYEVFLTEAENCDPPLEDTELRRIWSSVRRTIKKEQVLMPQSASEIAWEPPIPFDACELPDFPVDALPPVLRDYALAVAETAQTAVDLPAVALLPAIAICTQGKYRILGKADWSEPVNLYAVVVLPPAERKSAVLSMILRPLEEFEKKYNLAIDAELIQSRIERAALEKECRMLEDKLAKGKATREDAAAKARELSAFKDVKPLKLFADDITAEKLSSVLAENGSRAAIASAEGGIFDILNGIYTKSVNIDVFLKAHSGDSIRVDRIGRASETIPHPALTILLAMQPEVLSGLMTNGVFRGRGLTARFLYSMPRSALGRRRFDTEPIPEAVQKQYDALICTLLENSGNEQPLSLSPEASAVLEALFHETECRLTADLAEISDWAGKYVGAVLRMAGLLHIAENPLFPEFTEVSDETMRHAVQIGAYFLEHAKAAYSLMGADPVNRQCEYLLSRLRQNVVREFSRRDAMRMCRRFKTAEALQPILNRLCEYGYIAPKPEAAPYHTGRRPSEVYLVNPAVSGA